MASSRLAFGIVSAGALLWVYGLSALAAFAAAPMLPKPVKTLALVFISSFAAGLYLMLLWLMSPLLGMESFFLVSLIPLVCAGSGIFERIASADMGEAVSRALSEAAVLGALIIGLSLVRDPLGYLSLSLPGGIDGIVTLFSLENENLMPVRIAASSAGALLLLGYGTGVYRYFNGELPAGGGR
jgi:hypothetical protein